MRPILLCCIQPDQSLSAPNLFACTEEKGSGRDLLDGVGCPRATQQAVHGRLPRPCRLLRHGRRQQSQQLRPQQRRFSQRRQWKHTRCREILRPPPPQRQPGWSWPAIAGCTGRCGVEGVTAVVVLRFSRCIVYGRCQLPACHQQV